VSKQQNLRPWPRLMDIDTAADYLSLSRRILEQYVAEGQIVPQELPGVLGRKKLDKILFDRVVLDRFAKVRPE
jgi:hypothetical protein